jgi:hypothetical protein
LRNLKNKLSIKIQRHPLAKQKSKAQLQAELKLIKQSRVGEGVILICLNLIKWGAIVLIVREIHLSIESLAGKATLTDIGINFLGDIKVSIALSWFVGFFGAFYGINQRKLRKDTVERLQTRIKELELVVDNKRSSSQLTVRGDTRPEDKL